MQRHDVDGVPVLHTAGAGPLTAGLAFGVGRRDETFLGGGVTHLVEHLAMSALGRSTLDCNATVDLTTTQFLATGEPARVAEFLRRVCLALSDLPLDRVAVEADVLRTEGGVVAAPVVGALLAERYGATGVGLAGFREPAVARLTADDVRAWARRCFVRGNAALWLAGPLPDGLSLPLAEGPAPGRSTQWTRPLTTPALAEHAIDGAVALGAELPRAPGTSATTRILRNRAEDELRHRRGLSYSVDTEHVVVEGTRRFVAVTADCRDEQEAVVARALWLSATRLAESGPTEDELAHDREELAAYLADERWRVHEVQAAAEALVLGFEHRTVDDLERESSELTSEQVRSVAQALVAGSLLGVPFGTELRLTALTPLPSSSQEAVVGESFPRRRIRSDAPRGGRLVVGDDGVTVVLGEHERHTVRYADAVGLLAVAPQEWTLVGVDGTSLPLSPRDWRGGERALELVRAAVPAALQADVDGTTVGGRRVLLVHAPPPRAFEALWPSKQDTWLAQTPQWTLVSRDLDAEQAYATGAGMSATTGRHGAVLLLEQAFGELSVVVFLRGKERDRHVWTGEEHDPTVLAESLEQDPERIAALLAHEGPPADVLAALEQELSVPAQTAQLLAGADPQDVAGMRFEPARGFGASMAAAARGEYAPPDSTKLLDRWARAERERPAGYRAVNAGAAALQAALAAAAATRIDGDWTSGWGVLTAVLGLSALGSLWSTRPPPRQE